MILRTTAAVVFLLFSFILAVPGQDLSLSQPAIGFDQVYRSGHWTPLSIALQSNDSDVHGRIRLSVTQKDNTRYRLVRDVHSRAAEQTDLQFIVPVPSASFSVEAELYSGQKSVESETWELGATEVPQRLVLAVARADALAPLNDAHGTLAQNARIIHIAPEDLPTKPLSYDAVDTVIFYEARLSRLTSSAVEALGTWVRRGGQVITVGGVHLSAEDATRIEQLLPGKPAELARGMPSNWNTLFPLGIAGHPSTIYFSKLTPSPAAHTVPTEGAPLVAYEERGKGSVAFVATNLPTLGRIAMPGSGLWREAFPPLSQTGRIRFPTKVDRSIYETLIGNATLLDTPTLVPRRATITLLGLLYVVAIAVATRLVARGHSPPRAAVILPALLAAALTVALLLGAERGTWTPPAFVTKAELFRGTAPGHNSAPTPGVLQTDLLVVSRTGAEVELTLGSDLQPIPLRGRTLTLYEAPRAHKLRPEVPRGEELNYYIQSSMTVAITAELALSSSGVRFSLQNATNTDIEDAYVLWNDAVFRVGAVESGQRLRAPLIGHMPATEFRGRIPLDRASALGSISRVLASGAEPSLLVFFEEPFKPLVTPETLQNHSFSVGLFSLQHPSTHRVAGSGALP